MTLVYLILIAVFGSSIFFWIYSSHDHWKPTNGQSLKSDAKVIDMTTKLYNKFNYRTIIKFDDGFEYISFDTQREEGAFRRTLTVSPEMKLRILEKAMNKHKELLEKSV